MRAFEVRAGLVPSWPGVTPAGRVVAEFLARVRVIGDPAAAEELMTATVRCHQLTSEAPTTVLRTPGEYAEHVTEMFATFGRFAYRVTDLLAEGDRVYVRWEQTAADRTRPEGLHDADAPDGPGHPVASRTLVELGSAVYRVRDGRIAEYWIQLDRHGLLAQLDRTVSPHTRPHHLPQHHPHHDKKEQHR